MPVAPIKPNFRQYTPKLIMPRLGSFYSLSARGNIGFCNAVLDRFQPAQEQYFRTQSLVHRLEVPSETQPTVVNLLMQLKAYADSSNQMIMNRTEIQQQISNELHRQITTIHEPELRLRVRELEQQIINHSQQVDLNDFATILKKKPKLKPVIMK